MATNTKLRRLERLILTLAIASATVLPSWAGDWMPLLPDQNFYDFQLFAPPDLQDYEMYPEPSEGIYFNYDRLYWAITPPSVRGVVETPGGNYLIPYQPISPQTIVNLNNAAINAAITSGTTGSLIGGVYEFGSDPLRLDLNTSWMRTQMSWGNRYEGGWIYDGRGVNIDWFSIQQSQEFQTNSEFAAASPTQTILQTTASGGGGGTGGVGTVSNAAIVTSVQTSSPPPDHLISQKLTQSNNVEISSGAVAAVIRRELGGRGSGSTARFGLGPRYLQFAESYKLGYESNQYPFNVGRTTGGTGGTTGGATGGTGGTTGGATGGTTGGATGGTTGGATGGTGGTTAGTGGATGGTGGAIGGGTTGLSVFRTSAGDVVGITGYDTLTGLGTSTPLQVGQWETNTYNNIVGPEFSLLMETQRGRWQFSTALKFTAGFNWQNNLYRGSNFPNALGADYLRTNFNLTNAPQTVTTSGTAVTVQPPPPPMFLQLYGVGQQNATNAAEHRFVFTPIGEWRFGTEFKVSQAITLHAGYTGMWLGSIARASTNTGYLSDAKKAQYAEPLNPAAAASGTNPWVVKTTGAPPPGATAVPGAPNTFRDAQGNYYTSDTAGSNYYRPDPIYNRVGPVDGGQEYVFTNGVDFGITVKY